MIYKNRTTGLLFSLTLLMLTTVSFAETRYKIKSTDNLSKIIERYYPQSHLTKAQLLIGLLAKNQGAFRGGNINFLLRGKQLILPDESNLEILSDDVSKEILAKHARYFQRGETGDFGSPITMGYVVNKSQGTAVISKNQELQTVKIDQLEKESQDLRKRLEKLIHDKNESDAQLRKVEAVLQRTLKKAKEGEASVGSKSKVLEETKKKLDQQTKEKVDTFQSINAEKAQVSNSSGQLGESSEAVSANTTTSKRITNKETGIGSMMTMLQKYSLPLFGLLLFLFAWLFWSKNKKNRLIADEENIQLEIEQAYQDDKDFLKATTVEEESSTDTVKIDMATAYIDAGDIDSATRILNTLINEGNAAQRKRAQKLLNSL